MRYRSTPLSAAKAECFERTFVPVSGQLFHCEPLFRRRSFLSMKHADTYAEYAQECRRLALTAKPEDKAVLLQIAKAWDEQARLAGKASTQKSDGHLPTGKSDGHSPC